jgi:hypothetical protein
MNRQLPTFVLLGLCLIAVAATFLFFPLRRAFYPYVGQTVFRYAIDDRHSIRVFTQYYSHSGVSAYAELLEDGLPVAGPKDLFLDNKSFGELKFQTVVTEDAMVAIVRPCQPLKVLFPDRWRRTSGAR